ncbi:MAG: hypothetical protein HRT88_15040, partial [Lentisphaeraceae bacterium]|nr:hypothetical protein [Lentisphaeraceae bacterium]
SVGTKLKIMPSIKKDNTVTLYIELETSSKIINGGKIFFDGADRNIDTKSERKITATVLAKDRHTIAIGGLITTSYEDTIDKTPILGDIPLLGFFFRKEIKKEVKKEIVLLITPYIMNDATEGEHVTGDVMNKNSNHSFHTEGVNGIDKKNKNLQNRINDQQQAK